MRITALDTFTVKLKHQAQNTVRSRVLWAEIDVKIANFLFAGQDIRKPF
jgi:hypothetical protein